MCALDVGKRFKERDHNLGTGIASLTTQDIVTMKLVPCPSFQHLNRKQISDVSMIPQAYKPNPAHTMGITIKGYVA
jgi:hypothetical protein